MPLSRLLMTLVALPLIGACAVRPVPVGACSFVRDELQFEGSPLAQASCLLREVAPRGRVDSHAAAVPASLRRLIGQPTLAWKAPLRRYLASRGLQEQALGGSLDRPVSMAAHPGQPVPARYFVIHDTSWPWLGDQAFPAEDDPGLNDLAGYGHAATAQAHVFVNRLGQTYTAHTFDIPWRATKLETRVIGPSSRGLFLHVELVQARRRDPSGPAGNDALAPTPGFTPAQYETLAVLYLAASVRAGVGLVPGLHGALDDGLPDAHDDPQHFDLASFAAALQGLELTLSPPASPSSPVVPPAVPTPP